MEDAKDVPLPLELIKQHKMQRILIIVLTAEFIVFIIFSIWITEFMRSRAIPIGSVQVGTVKYGNLKLYIKGMGILKPRNERWITSGVNGTVEDIFVHPGALVKKGEPLLKLSNDKIYNNLEQVELALIQNKEQAISQREKYNNHLYSLDQELFDARENLDAANLHLAAERELEKRQIVSRLQLRSAILDVKKDKASVRVLKDKIEDLQLEMNAQHKSNESLIKSAQEVVAMAKRSVSDLRPVADMTGEVESVRIEVGQRVGSGTPLVRMASANHYNAVLSVRQSKIGLVKKGQKVSLELRVPRPIDLSGQVTRISPNLKHGMISVTVAVDGTISRLARPYMPVIGVIHAGTIHNTLYVEKPVNAVPERTDFVYVLSPHGHEATARKVHFGISSEIGIQILSGLKVGERIITSTTYHWKNSVRLTTDG